MSSSFLISEARQKVAQGSDKLPALVLLLADALEEAELELRTLLEVS